MRIPMSRQRALVAAAALLMALSACAPPASNNNAANTDAAKATSAADLGGLDKLIAVSYTHLTLPTNREV